jgi:hypothetical protein
MGGITRCGLGLLVMLAIWSPAQAAAPRIALSMRGDQGGVLTDQLTGELCTTYECVSRVKVYTAGKPDFAKVRKLRVSGILSGTVRTKGERKLSLALFTRSHRPTKTWVLPVNREQLLGADSLASFIQDLDRLMGFAPARKPPSPPPPPPPPPSAPPIVVEPPPPVVLTPPPPEPEPPKPAPPPPIPVIPFTERAQPWALGIELGVQFTQRNLSYQGLAAAPLIPLQGDDSRLIYSPRARLELFPISLLTNGVVGGLGLFGEYAVSVGLKSVFNGAPENTLFTRLQGGLVWRIRPAVPSRFVIAPSISYQVVKFQVDRTYQALPGFPDTDLIGWKGALNLEVPLADTVTFLAGGGFVKWTRARNLIDAPAFFPGGVAYAIEVEGGFAVAIAGPASLRLVGEYCSTRYLFDADATPPSATGATDRYLGGRAMLRVEF